MTARRITLAVLGARVETLNGLVPRGFTCGTQHGQQATLQAQNGHYRINLSGGAHISQPGTARETLMFLDGMIAALSTSGGLSVPSVWP